jgi:hypothetical protein
MPKNVRLDLLRRIERDSVSSGLINPTILKSEAKARHGT